MHPLYTFLLPNMGETYFSNRVITKLQEVGKVSLCIWTMRSLSGVLAAVSVRCCCCMASWWGESTGGRTAVVVLELCMAGQAGGAGDTSAFVRKCGKSETKNDRSYTSGARFLPSSTTTNLLLPLPGIAILRRTIPGAHSTSFHERMESFVSSQLFRPCF